jgi:hypothetical protein
MFDSNDSGARQHRSYAAGHHKFILNTNANPKWQASNYWDLSGPEITTGSNWRSSAQSPSGKE